jgi:hypothetical protein
VDVELFDELAKKLGGVPLPLGNRRGQPQMIGTARENATATILPDQQELRLDLLTGMLRRQPLPPGEAADA